MRDVEGIAERMFLGRVATRFIETFPDFVFRIVLFIIIPFLIMIPHKSKSVKN